MSRTLHIDGTVDPDGIPYSAPPLIWEWNGGTRADPGEEVSYASDRKSGAQRLMQRPFSRRGTLWLPASDVGEIGTPLRELARAGIMLEDDRLNELDAGEWDITSWAQNSSTTTGGERGPTGEVSGIGQAYKVTPNSDSAWVEMTETVPTNFNADTYVYSIWVRKLAGVSSLVTHQLGVGGDWNRLHVVVGDEWTRLQIPSLNQATTTPRLVFFPGGLNTEDGNNQDPVLVWAPQLENLGGAAGESDMGAGSTVSLASTRVRSQIKAVNFPWPAPPWTLRCDFTPFWGGTNGLAHIIFEGRSAAGAAIVYQLGKTSGNSLQWFLTERGGGTRTATQAVTFSQREEQRVVIVSKSNGDVDCYLNGTAFSSQIAAPDGLVSSAPAELWLSNSTSPTDGILHSLEVWDREMDPARLF